MTPPAHVDSYYAATANPAPEHAALEGEITCDVCVVGAGFTGISTALNLAEKGFDVVVLEAARVGWGASGRNGGQVGSGYVTGMSKIARWVGEDDARKLWHMVEESKAIIIDRTARHGIRCDLRCGFLLAAMKPGEMKGLAEWVDSTAQTYGYDKLALLDRAALRERLGSDIYHGGVSDSGSGHLHPLNYVLGLADAAATAGVRIFEGSRVVRLEAGPRAAAHTQEGLVRADHLVLCCNAYLGKLSPALRRTIMPVGTYIAATEPLGENRARTLIRDDEAVCDTKFVLDYYRLSADRRMLFGGRVSYSTVQPPGLEAEMRRKMLRVYPQLSDAHIDYCWGGHVAITAERTPHLGRLTPNMYFAQGFSGHGVALTGIAGKVMAEAIAGTAERFDVFARLPHTAFPGGELFRTPLLALTMLYYRLRDLL